MSNNKDLLTVNRLDVIFKLLYLKLKKNSPKLALQLYHDHVKIITNGLFEEKDNGKKCFKDFLNEFENINQSIENHGFNSKISRIPLSIDGSISNGAHRLASSLFNDIEVNTTNTSQKSHNYNYEFFKTRAIENHLLELGILTYISLTENNFLAIIWPSADRNIKYINYFDNILYEKKLILNSNGAQNFVAQVYKKHKWLGDFENGYSGAITKVSKVYNRNNPIHLIFFKEKSLKKVNLKKEKLRNIFSIGKSSIHITDNQEETLDLATLLLNENSQNFLNASKPYKFKSLFSKLKSLKEDLERNNFDSNDIVLTGSTTLGIYGIREPKDVDYLSSYIDLFSEEYQNHKSQIKYYSTPIEDLIYDSKNYFTFNGFKFLCLEKLKEFKENRNEEKDKMDLMLMENQKIKLTNNINYYIRNTLTEYKFKIIALIIPISKKFKFYRFAKKVYKIFN